MNFLIPIIVELISSTICFFCEEKIILREAKLISQEVKGLVELFETYEGSNLQCYSYALSSDRSKWAIIVEYNTNDDASYSANIRIEDKVFLCKCDDGSFLVNYDYIIDTKPVRVLISDPDGLGLNRQYKSLNQLKIVKNISYSIPLMQKVDYVVKIFFRGIEIYKIETSNNNWNLYGNLINIFSVENMRKIIPDSIPIIPILY